MNDTGPFDAELFKGLQAVSAASFPKQCGVCGRRYDCAEDFTRHTADMNGKSGLKASHDELDGTIIELFRNCECGSTLMDCFNDRRGSGENATRRRAVFQKTLDLLENKGLKPGLARKELRGIMQGKESAIINKLGIRLSARKS